LADMCLFGKDTVPDLKTRPYQDIGVMFSLQKKSVFIRSYLCSSV
jgi:hypothetical protein